MKTATMQYINLPLQGNVEPTIREYVSMSKSIEIQSFCHALKEIGIDFFVYSRRCNNVNYLHLTNNTEWLETFLRDSLYLQCAFHHPTMQYDSGNFLWESMPAQQTLNAYIQSHFGIRNVLTKVQPYEKCQEFFSFGTAHDSNNLINIYINHFDLLQRFILCFKDKYYTIIEKHFTKRLVIPAKNSENLQTEKQNKSLGSLYHLADLRRYYVGDQSANAYLTRREIECLQWFVEGKTFSEIGMILGMSSRTVETHLNHVKEKTHCYTRAQLSANFAPLFSSKIHQSSYQANKSDHILQKNDELIHEAA